jgi:DNA-binding MarR family transcriptional regulator
MVDMEPQLSTLPLVAETTPSDLVSELHRSIQDQLRTLIAPYRLTLTQAAALRALGNPMTQRELASSLCCEPSNVTFIVDRLESDGLLTRQPHPTDRRAKLLALTPRGVEVRNDILRALRDNPPLSSVNADRVGRLTEVLREVLEEMEDQSA